MDVTINTRRPLARAALALFGLLLTPFGLMVLVGAFERNEPHIFVMLIFSGSLTLLLGLVGLIGFVASFAKKSPDKSPDDLR